jgi:PAS domain S-box-containing protein
MGKETISADREKLRRLAEKALKETADDKDNLSEKTPEDISSLIHELRVHQIELEMQNEELRRIQGELEKARDRYSHLYDFAPMGYFTGTEKGIITEANLTFASMLGAERSVLIGKPFTHFVLKDDQDIYYKHRQRLMEIEEPQMCELRLVKKDAHEFYARLECMVINNKDDDLKQIRVTVSDITERKQAEEALRESEEKYRILTEESPIAVSLIGRDGRYKYFNPKFTEIFGYRLEDIPTGKEWFRKAYPDERYRKRVIATWIDDQKKHGIGEARRRTFNVKCKDGSEKVIHFRPVTLDKGDQIVLYEDITERKRAEEEKEKLEDQLRQSQKMESIGTLAGGIAHEFNNILGVIIGNNELAMMDVPDWSPAKDCLKEIQKASLRAKDVVRNILSFTRKTPPQRKPIQISTVIKDSLKLLRASIPTMINIRQNILCEREMILADSTEMNQALMNLCTNAVQAVGDEAGVLEVSLEPTTLDEESVAKYVGLNPGNFVKLTVRDTGHGIDPKIIDRIFDPYFTTKSLAEKTGMGLAIVYGIVKKHDGAIRVESEVGKEALFEVLFPLFEGEEEEVKEEPEDLPKGTERILFVDDEESLVKTVKRMLGGLGYQIETRTSSLEALELFKGEPHRFDLVITDMGMPKMAGDRLAQELIRIQPDIPIIICTGYSERIDEDKAKEMGIRAYITKPLVMKDLEKTVRKVLNEAKSRTQQ